MNASLSLIFHPRATTQRPFSEFNERMKFRQLRTWSFGPILQHTKCGTSPITQRLRRKSPTICKALSFLDVVLEREPYVNSEAWGSFICPIVIGEPHDRLARLVLLGARTVTAVVLALAPC